MGKDESKLRHPRRVVRTVVLHKFLDQAPLDLAILRLNRPLSRRKLSLRQFLGDQLQLLDDVRRLVESGFVHEDWGDAGVAVEEVVKVFHQLQSLHCARARRVHTLKLISEVDNLACYQVDPFVEAFVGGSCCLVPLRIELVKPLFTEEVGK